MTLFGGTNMNKSSILLHPTLSLVGRVLIAAIQLAALHWRGSASLLGYCFTRAPPIRCSR